MGDQGPRVRDYTDGGRRLTVDVVHGPALELLLSLFVFTTGECDDAEYDVGPEWFTSVRELASARLLEEIEHFGCCGEVWLGLIGDAYETREPRSVDAFLARLGGTHTRQRASHALISAGNAWRERPAAGLPGLVHQVLGLVDVAIAVVVQPVTDFGGRGGVRLADDLSIVAGIRARSAGRLVAAGLAHVHLLAIEVAGDRQRTRPVRIVVDESVAVVVESVTGLGDWTDFADALTPIGRQILGDGGNTFPSPQLALAAGAATAARATHIDRVVVDQSVAVIVHPVALFGIGAASQVAC